MATINISPPASSNDTAFEVVSIQILVDDVDFVGSFDLIEVWRSRDTMNGPYEELTADSWRPARLPKAGEDQPASPVTGPNVNIVGKTLELLLKEKDTIPVTFTGVDPLTFAQVATQIAAQSAGRLRSYVDANAAIVIETMEPGAGVSLRVLESDAAFLLALPTVEPDALAFGHDARIQLAEGQSTYIFNDNAGASSYFYKTRFRNRSTGALSEYSLPFGADQALGIAASSLVLGTLDLLSNDGKPLVGRTVSLRSNFNGTLVDGKLVAGTDLTASTDKQGHVEFTLVRGQTYSLAIAGLNLTKEVTAPTDVSIASFNLVDPAYSTQDDYFRVRVPQIPTLERRTF